MDISLMPCHKESQARGIYGLLPTPTQWPLSKTSLAQARHATLGRLKDVMVSILRPAFQSPWYMSCARLGPV